VNPHNPRRKQLNRFRWRFRQAKSFYSNATTRGTAVQYRTALARFTVGLRRALRASPQSAHYHCGPDNLPCVFFRRLLALPILMMAKLLMPRTPGRWILHGVDLSARRQSRMNGRVLTLSAKASLYLRRAVSSPGLRAIFQHNLEALEWDRTPDQLMVHTCILMTLANIKNDGC
jgi:hypothetical protein